jgi:tRNA A37 threonylcarbamoyladenosine modification protein TsaB
MPLSFEKYLLLFANTLEIKIILINMNNLVIDAANDKIFFTIIADNKSYTSEFSNNRENFDKLAILVVKFLENHHLNIKNLSNIFVNQGPGKFSGIRASLATAKALSFVNKIDLYGFSSDQVINQNYVEIIELFNKGLLIKNLIKPQY